MTAEPLDLELLLAEVKAKQGKPAQPSGPRRRRIPNLDAPPAPPDAAERAAGDYDAEDLETAQPPAAEVPAHLRQYLVTHTPAGESRLERSRRQLGGTKEAPVIIGNDHGWLGCDWPGLARMAAARLLAGLVVDDLDVEALKRAGWTPIDETWTPPAAASSSSSSSAAPPETPSSSPSPSSAAS